MLKFFLLILFLVGVYLLFFRKNQQKPTKNDFKSTQDSIMLECTQCGTYVYILSLLESHFQSLSPYRVR